MIYIFMMKLVQSMKNELSIVIFYDLK